MLPRRYQCAAWWIKGIPYSFTNNGEEDAELFVQSQKVGETKAIYLNNKSLECQSDHLLGYSGDFTESVKSSKAAPGVMDKVITGTGYVFMQQAWKLNDHVAQRLELETNVSIDAATKITLKAHHIDVASSQNVKITRLSYFSTDVEVQAKDGTAGVVVFSKDHQYYRLPIDGSLVTMPGTEVVMVSKETTISKELRGSIIKSDGNGYAIICSTGNHLLLKWMRIASRSALIP